MRRMLWTAVALMAGAFGTAQAQAPLARGELIRVTANGDRFNGHLVGWTADSLVVLDRGVEKAIKRADLLAVEHVEGRKPALAHGAFIGSLVGSAGLAVVMGLQCGKGNLWGCEPGAGHAAEGALMGALFGAALGAPIGLIVGAFFHEPAWRKISVAAQPLAMHIVVSPESVAIRVRIATWR